MSYAETLLQSSSYLVTFPPKYLVSYLWSKEKVFDPIVVNSHKITFV